MKLVKSLLLGSAAGIAAVAGAQAADLPSRKAAANPSSRSFPATTARIPSAAAVVRTKTRSARMCSASSKSCATT